MSLPLLPRLHAALAARHADIERILSRSEGLPTAMALHDLRVTLRRTAALAKLTRDVPRAGDGEPLRKAARDLRRALSMQRTREVAYRRLQTRFRRDPAKQKAALTLARHIERQANESRNADRALAGPLSSLRNAFALRESDLAPHEATPLFSTNSKLEKLLGRKISTRLEGKRKRLLRDGIPSAETLHPTRIRLKDFRYSLEFVEETIPGVNALLPSLKEFQTAAGDANDRFELVALVEDVLAKSPSARRRAVDLVPALSRDAERALQRARQMAVPVLERLAAMAFTMEPASAAGTSVSP